MSVYTLWNKLRQFLCIRFLVPIKWINAKGESYRQQQRKKILFFNLLLVDPPIDSKQLRHVLNYHLAGKRGRSVGGQERSTRDKDALSMRNNKINSKSLGYYWEMYLIFMCENVLHQVQCVIKNGVDTAVDFIRISFLRTN